MSSSVRRLAKLLTVGATLVWLTGCGTGQKSVVESQTPPAQQPQAARAAVSKPTFEGTGAVNDALKVDVSVTRTGEYGVALTDARGYELPAAEASHVAIAFRHPAPPADSINLNIDDTGEKWVGRGSPIQNATATAFVTLSVRGESLSATVPLASLGGSLDYVCPMHPDVRSATPGVCPRCGMQYVLGLPDPEEYPMDLKLLPAGFRVGQHVKMSFNIKDPATTKPVTHFEVVHERLFHLFIISSDLKYFVHDHPDFNPDGTFRYDEVFPKPGMYRVLADFYPKGGTPQLIPRTVFVPGAQGAPLAIDTAQLLPDTHPQQGGNTQVEVALNPPQPVAGEVAMLVFRMTPGDKMERYLGAWAHMLMASDDVIDLVHDHPSTADGSSQMTFYLTFPRAKVYRLWLQFQRNGVINTVAFNIPVAHATVARK